MGAMGDEAEAIHDSVYPRHHKLGINRPPMAVQNMSLKARYTPDRQHVDSLVEVMGCGRDGVIKIKVEKVVALLQWSATDPIKLFLWNSHRKTWAIGDLDPFVDALFQHGVYGLFPEGKPYIGLHVDHVPFDWTKYDPPEE